MFATGLDEPKGICFVGEYLVATDLKRVVKIDASGRVAVLAEGDDFPVEVRYLNDAATAPDGKSVFITDMGDRDNLWQSDRKLHPVDSKAAAAFKVVGRVFQIGLDGTVTSIVQPSPLMVCPNGVGVANDGSLLIGGFFTGNILKYTDGKLEVMATDYRGADAVEEDACGNLYVSSWNQGKVWRIAPDGSATVLIENLETAADFYLDEETRKLFLPDMLTGKIHILRID